MLQAVRGSGIASRTREEMPPERRIPEYSGLQTRSPCNHRDPYLKVTDKCGVIPRMANFAEKLIAICLKNPNLI